MAAIRLAFNEGLERRDILIWGGAIVVVMFVVSMIIPDKRPDGAEAEAARPEQFDAFAGGHPVPPMPGQRLEPPVAAGASVGGSQPGEGPGTSNSPEEGTVPDFLDPIAGFGVTFRTMFRKVVTEQYPEQRHTVAPRFHGRHQLNRHPDGLEKCIGCELCAWACPADAIYVEGDDQHRRAAVLAGRALRPRLPDQLPALHLLWALHRGVPHPGTDDDQRVRARRRQPREV